jgi:hypothetical protein
VTATLPVSGIPGLTVQVSIPALSNPVAPTAYTANGADLQFNGLPNPTTGPPNLLTLTFSQPINGVGLEIGNLVGRFEYKYALLVGDGSANNVLPFENSAQGYTLDLLTPRSENLQLVGLDTTFTTVTVAFSGDPGEGLQSPIISNIRVQSSSAADSAQSIPTDGLQQWLRIGDAGSVLFSDSLVWKDQSGNGHNATATPGHQPTLVAQGRSCRGTWRFDGSSSFDFILPISGWSEMTVFLVGRSTKDPAPEVTSPSLRRCFGTRMPNGAIPSSVPTSRMCSPASVRPNQTLTSTTSGPEQASVATSPSPAPYTITKSIVSS